MIDVFFFCTWKGMRVGSVTPMTWMKDLPSVQSSGQFP